MSLAEDSYSQVIDLGGISQGKKIAIIRQAQYLCHRLDAKQAICRCPAAITWLVVCFPREVHSILFLCVERNWNWC